MRVKPKKWTHHHVNRLLHASLLAAFLTLTVVVLVGMMLTLTYTRANQESQSAPPITASATVPEFSQSTTTPPTSTPPSILPGPVNGTSYFIPPIASSTPGSRLPATISIRPDVVGRIKIYHLQGGQDVYLLTTDQPGFFGETSVNYGFIYLDVRGPLSFRSTSQAAGSGKWSWVSPETLPAGNYSITARVEDPFSPDRGASAVLFFAINIPPSAPIPPPAAEAGKTFDLFVKVLPESKVVYPGQSVTLAVRLVGNSQNRQQLVLEYTLTGQNGSKVSFSDSVDFSGGSSEFLKTFNTNPLADPGTYTVTVRVRDAGALSAASDQFVIRGPGVVPIAAGVILDATMLFQILLVLFLLFALITYFEYNKVSMLSKAIHRVDEEDLRKEE